MLMMIMISIFWDVTLCLLSVHVQHYREISKIASEGKLTFSEVH